jgi:hypothetical protein
MRQALGDDHIVDHDALTRSRRVLGDAHPATLLAARNLAADLRALGRNDEARSLEDTMAEWRGSS